MDYNHNEVIAIIGTGCRFPGNSTNPSKLWNLLREPKDVLTEIPVERFDPNGFYHVDGMHHGTTDVHESYLLSDDHRQFDAQFFNINPMEASSMDPQQRGLLETVYESLEAAGQTLESLRGSSTAVFVGLMCEEYSNHLLRDPDTTPVYMATGTARSIMSNRISYFFDWHGASMTIDTACSSSLVALHQAVGALRAGESRMAVVAGSNLILSPEPYIGESKLKMLSPGSRSRMWDIDADGYARGDGIASIVLKTLKAALEDGDDIECVIRASGVNQDGKTPGITMPSATAQASLIRDTYAKAGLDPRSPSGRCQYFEAHGTGTPAGDPMECEAISRAFFDPESSEASEVSGKLYVGSIKTVIGHTEGTAGLAGVIKASLALQNGVIPPNMLFKTLNPALTPFYHNLEVPVVPVPWPLPPNGQPRRASINSFGFGGTNAHVILESYESVKIEQANVVLQLPMPMPFLFSAASAQSLTKMLSNYSSFLKSNTPPNIRDMLYTLSSRRSVFSARTSISASTTEQLVSKIDNMLSVKDKDITVRGSPSPPSIIGIFTGQGAQWADMGRELLLESPKVQSIITFLDQTLANLPPHHRPSWTLKDQLLAPSSESRLSEATISQPLCTAIQIVLVDLVYASGVKFKAVVGHSSGEIGAAYAAGYISARDAIIIAYYRGFYAHLGRKEKPGAMLAAGTSVDDATELCAFPELEGRICVAACNSSASVTLSGDADAIEEARILLEDEGKFARILRVDTAYHSHHMIPCSDPYTKALAASDIKILSPAKPSCIWYSSVDGSEMTSSRNDLKSTYWNDNMRAPVLFSDALKAAFSGVSPFNLAIEVGPHPALQGPVLQNFQDFGSQGSLLYTGTLKRGRNSSEALSDALGFVLENFGPEYVAVSRFCQLASGNTEKPLLLKGLPMYPWDHDRIFWFESRITKAYRTRSSRSHELLGTVCSDSNEEILQWRNLLRPTELPWLSGHRLQGQMIFPAAAYVVTALEAAKTLAKGRSIVSLEVRDLAISRSITFEEADLGVETVFALNNIKSRGVQGSTVSANFTHHAGLGKSPDNLSLVANGLVQIVLGDPVSSLFPPRKHLASNLVDVDHELFYNCLEQVGYGYSGPFKALVEMRRKLDVGTGLLENPHPSDPRTQVMIHPGLLDAVFQSLFLAFSWPGDGSLKELHVPTKIRSIRVNPMLCETLGSEGALPFDCFLTKRTSKTISGDVSMYSSAGEHTIVQVQGIEIVPFAPPSPENDRWLFSRIDWDVAAADGEAAAADDHPTAENYKFAYVAEQTALWYMQKVLAELSPTDWAQSEWHHAHLLNYITSTISTIESGEHEVWKKDWLENTSEDIAELGKQFPDSFELELIRAVGENLSAAVRGEVNILEFMMHGNMLGRLYAEGTGVGEQAVFLGRMAKQLVHRYPQSNILEIGAGTGGATKRALKEMGQAFASYTFTDISPGFFEKAQQLFEDYSSRMVFKTLDVEKNVEAQGFVPASYDVVIASLVLHATKDIEATLINVRRLLKPGGILLMCELSPPPLRMGFIFSGLPGWWLGIDDGRTLSPCITAAQWHTVLRKTGFSGVDSTTPEIDFMVRPGFVLASQAVDNRIMALRQPLASPPTTGIIPELTIIGGLELEVSKLVDDLTENLASYCVRIRKFSKLEQIQEGMISSTSVVLVLAELDEPVFKSMTKEKLEGVKWLFDQARTVLWITRGCKASVPYSNIAVGFGRSVAEELPHVRLQFLDLDPVEKPNANLIAAELLRGHMLDTWESDRVEGKLLWSKEPEMRQEGGRTQVPRLIANKPRNDVYNSGRRPITKDIDLRASVAELDFSETSYRLREQLQSSAFDSTDIGAMTSVKVTHSLLSPMQVSTKSSLYLVLGTNSTTNKTALAFSKTNASTVRVSAKWVRDYEIPPGRESDILCLAGNELIAQYILSEQYGQESMVVHEPQPELADLILEISIERQIRIKFTTHVLENLSLPGPWVLIHPMMSDDDIKQSLPSDISIFVDLSPSTGTGNLSSIIEPSLPSWCKVTNLGSIFATGVRLQGSGVDGKLSEFFQRFSQKLGVPNCLRWSPESIERTTVGGLLQQSKLDKLNMLDKLIVVEWTKDPILPVLLEPVDSRDLFVADRTYILFGLTSNLGQSLVTWMVQRGARHVVLTSRHPDIDQSWIQSFERLGAIIKVFPNDITDKKALQKLCQEIRNSCPPIGGIANGAMVLQDTLIRDLDIDTLLKVLKPKVDGSRYLDEIFREDKLDFCIFFSSLAGIYGNRGQANYSAANAFMTALATQRRSRGQAASILHLGAVMGAGYVSRQSNTSLIKSLDRAGWLWLSERDFHQSFAESIVLGRSNFEQNCEVLVGVRRVEPDEGSDRQWYDNPKFQHCATQQGNVLSSKHDTAAGTSLKSQLLGATTETEVHKILKDSFITKLRTALQLQEMSEEKQDALLTLGADQLGIDSLIAVELRSWFLKEYQVDIHVLKMLGGDTVGQILDDAVERLPRELIPNVISSDSGQFQQPDEIKTPSSEEDTVSEPVSPSLEDMNTASSSSVSSVPLEELHFGRTEEMGYGQSRFWSLRSLLEDHTTFNIVCSGRITGPLRIPQFGKAISKVSQVHEVLRTAFFESKDNTFLQGILSQSNVRLEQQDIAHEDEVAREHEAMRAHKFDLETGNTFRVKLLSLSSRSHFLVIGYHHIVMDGVSLEVFLSDVSKAYDDLDISPPALDYCDFSLKEREKFQSGQMDKELAFWRKEFPDIPPPLPLLPFSHTRSRQNLRTYNFTRASARVPSKLASRIKIACKEHKVTPFHFYLAGLKSLLLRILDTEEICIGMADANRRDNEIMGSMGMFLNLLPLRFRAQANQEFKEALREARTKAYAALVNGNVPFNILLEELNVPRSASHAPLFQAFINYRQGVQEKRSFLGCDVEGLDYQFARSSYDIVLDVIDNPGGESTIAIMLQDGLYSESDAKSLLDYLLNLLEAAAENSSVLVGSIPIFSSASIKEALVLGKGPDVDSRWGPTLCHHVDDVVKERDLHVAINDGTGQGLSYAQMSHRINQISTALQAHGLRAKSTVGVFQEPTSDWICSLLAIWRIGAIYVPLDTRNPAKRLEAIISDCKPAGILVHEATAESGSSLASGTACLINISTLSEMKPSAVPNRALPEGIAAIIYTSGSTNTPKGILLKHSALVNQIEHYVQDLLIGPQVVLQQSAFSFDMSIWQVFMGLAGGGSVFVVPSQKRRDPIALTNLILTEGVTLTIATPSEYMNWLKYGSPLQKSTWTHAVSGGEPLTQSLKEAFREMYKPDFRLFNLYGPTECTISCHTTEILYALNDSGPNNSESMPVGFSIRNTSTYIVDDDLQPLPVGFPGEVVVGGAGVASGYLDNDSLTDKRFPNDPHASPLYLAKGWSKMHRTGDRGRLREDGALILGGRITGDTQVKLRGIRIDLQDVEAALIQAGRPVITEAVVSLRGEPPILVAHVVFSPDYPSEAKDGFLKRLMPSIPLPQDMRPAMIIALNAMPITTHFKADRLKIQKLPLEQDQQLADSGRLTEVEKQLKQIWESVLPKDAINFHDITVDSDFFYSGGNSGVLVRLQALVRDEFDVILPLFEFFESSTLGAMASKIENSVPQGVIDWEKETSITIDEEIVVPARFTAPRSTTASVVLLTGATGFLGQKILQHLIDDARISKIHCVVRPSSQGGQRVLHTTSNKLVVHSGNLQAPLLGLPNKIFQNLAQEVDVIIHSGAQRSFWEYYQLLRRANVSSTKELVKLAAPRKIPIHFISSGGVLNLGGSYTDVAETMVSHPPPSDGSNGYVASKWASERVLEVAAEKFGVPVYIHRTLPAADNSNSPSDVLEQFLKLTLKMKTLPIAGEWTGEMDLMPINAICRGICSTIHQDDDSDETFDPRYLNHYAQVKLSGVQLAEHLDRHCSDKGEFVTMPALEWMWKIKGLGFGYFIASQKMTLDDTGKWSKHPLVSSA